MPQVEILAEGDHVNELMIVVGGLVEVIRPAEHVLEQSGGGGGKDDDASTHGGSVSGHSMSLGSRCELQLHFLCQQSVSANSVMTAVSGHGMSLGSRCATCSRISCVDRFSIDSHQRPRHEPRQQVQG